MKSIKSILMRRDGLTDEEAQSMIDDARVALDEYLADGDIYSASMVCEEYLGLESDYLFELA